MHFELGESLGSITASKQPGESKARLKRVIVPGTAVEGRYDARPKIRLSSSPGSSPEELQLQGMEGRS